MFTLLQNLYAVFDRSARKLGVFKVETIGDSYGKCYCLNRLIDQRLLTICLLYLCRAAVAVTGLPDPQKNHAVIMARFAMECKSKMRDVTKKLVKTLGPETEDLRMRFGKFVNEGKFGVVALLYSLMFCPIIGLHSGPVTAGVLLGERSRFQLFGDTVNTGKSISAI